MQHIYAYLIAALIICHVPVINRVFFTVNTLVHESGHAIAALLTSGKVYSISLFLNSEGIAETGTKTWFSRFIVSIAGYPTSSFVAFICFFLIYSEKVQYVFYGLLGLAVVSLILWVRNLYGVIWLTVFIGCFIYLEIYQVSTFVKESFTLLLSCIILIHSVSSACTIFYLSLFKADHAGDATHLAKQTFIPAVIWGLIFFSQSIVSLYYVFTLYIL